jgi:Ca-activated chloride channel family protein
VGWLLWRAQRRRMAAARAFVDPTMVERLMPSLGGARSWIKGTLMLAGLASLIVAAARPRFGVYTETVAAKGLDLFVLLDVSRSMTAQDVAPSRMERAKSDILDLLPHLTQDRVGLIVFAGKPVVKVPLTNDRGFFQEVLKEVDVGSAPRGGTLIGDAIRKALENMPRSRERDTVIVLLTDGEDQESYAEDAAKAAAERGTKIFTVGLGDASEGARIPLRDSSGKLNYLQYEGQEHWSKLNNDLLKNIALMTGGAYIPAGTTAYDLGQIYQDHLAGLTRSDYQSEKRKRYRERFQWFAFLGIALLLIEMSVASYPVANRFTGSEVVRRRSSPLARSGLTSSPSRYVAPLLTLLTLFMVPHLAMAASADAPAKVRAGMASYQSGDYKQAAEDFADGEAAKPEDLRIAFDRGVALAALGDDKAVECFQKAAMSPDLDLAVKARYNLGCFAASKAHKRFGEHPEKASLDDRKLGLEDLATAVGHFRDCLRLDKNNADARQNLELIRVWVKNMQSLWEQNDRQKQRDELDLSAYLQMLEGKQRALRMLTKALAKEDDSPKRHEAQRQLELGEQKLGEEIEPLKQKIEATLAKAMQSPQAAAASADDLKKAVGQMQSFADDIGRKIGAAASDLHGGKFDPSLKQQTAVVEDFNQLFRTTCPFPTLVGKSVETQDALVKLGDAKLQAASATSPAKSSADSAETGWEQDFVTHYAELLAPMAKEGLKQLEAAGPATPSPAVSARSGANQAPNQSPSPEELAKQREGLKRAMEKAVEFGPKVEELSGEAAELLRKSKPNDALPKQKECLKLLNEIADLLPKQDQQDQNKDDKKQQDKSDPNKKDDNKKDDNKKNDDKHKDDKDKDKTEKQNQPDKDKQDKDKQDKDKQDKNKPNKDKSEKSKQEQGKQEQQQPSPKSQQETAKDQAEAAIRQVQERQQERKGKEKEFQRIYMRPGAVDKDW